MQRGLSGQYTASIAGGVACRAFVPAPLPPLPPLAFDGRMRSRMHAALLGLGRLDAIHLLLPDADLFLYSYVRKEAVMSSQIEGTQSSLSDLLLYEMEGQPGVPLHDVEEVSCHVRALNLGMQRIREGQPIGFRLLCELHAVLMASGRGSQRAPGEFRRNQVWVGGHRADQAIFIPPPAHLLADCFGALERFIHDMDVQTPPLIKAALVHVQFETIHPFMDGNGRLGRLLIPLILAQAGVLHEPMLYLSVFFKAHRQIYYELLQKVRDDGDWEAWLLFFVDAVATTADHALATVQYLNALLESDLARLPALGRQAGSARQLLRALFARPLANIATLAQLSGLTPATTGKTLAALEEKLGIVRELSGMKRGRLYVYSAYIEILNRDLA